MLGTLLTQTIGAQRAEDLQRVLAFDPALSNGAADKVPSYVLAGALQALLFEDLLKRSPTALDIVAEAVTAGELLTLDHAALATLDAPYTGGLERGRHHLGRVLEPMGYVQMEQHAVAGAEATAHIYRYAPNPGLVPDFVVMEIHALRFAAETQAAARQVFGEAQNPRHVRVQTALNKLNDGQDLPVAEAAAFLQSVFLWFGRQHVPPTLDDYEILAESSPMTAWMAHEGQGLSHMSLRVGQLSSVIDRQITAQRDLQEVKSTLDQTTRLVSLMPDAGPRPFRNASNGIVQMEVPIANLAFIERGVRAEGDLFEPALF